MRRLLPSYVADALSLTQAPRFIAFAAQIPQGPTGRSLRRELAEFVRDDFAIEGGAGPEV